MGTAKKKISHRTADPTPTGATPRATRAGANPPTAAPGGARQEPGPAPDVAAMVESIVGCKWSLHVLDQIRRGVNRPGAITRSTEGLSTKVLAERLDKMLRFGIVRRTAYAEVPPRVEYSLTPFGERFVEILDAVERLKHDAAAGTVDRN
jgi:DNA-binding HxlR family transcriptional regulator